MSMLADYCRYDLKFRFTAKTSRATMHEKETWLLRLRESDDPDAACGIGECALFQGLSDEGIQDYESMLRELCRSLRDGAVNDATLTSTVKFGLETAMLDLTNGGKRVVYPSKWVEGQSDIRINGLIWMGDKQLMFERIRTKLNQGFRCLKLKIGGIDFAEEVELLRYIRSRFSPESLELRLDANGAFSPNNALMKLEQLSHFSIHSIEQPIAAHNRQAMAQICCQSPIPIALDEELIGIHTAAEKEQMLDTIRPTYIILKPSLCGGLEEARKWIDVAERKGIGWWVTSALESNIGLNAIAQFTAQFNPTIPQGLGTGALYHNNIVSPLCLNGERLSYNPDGRWEIPQLEWIFPAD